MLSFSTPLLCDPTSHQALMDLMEAHGKVVNAASKICFESGFPPIKELHQRFYHPARKRFPKVPSQVVIRAMHEAIACYRTMKSGGKPIRKPFEKKNLSIRLDKRLFSLTDRKDIIRITTLEGRMEFRLHLYPRLQAMLDRLPMADPLVFVRGGKLMISLTFDVAVPQKEPTTVLGVDLGMRRVAACSDGRLVIDREFNKQKRKLRYLKRQLQSRGTKSARKHLRKLKRKERNINRNQTHLIANAILRTDANCIALENLKGIKAKKHKKQNKNAISQVPMYDLRRIIEYKAKNAGKSVRLVSPAYTSQIDSVSGIREGLRKGCRFYAVSGRVYDADLNAASNIARRSKLPLSNGGLAVVLDGQGVVNRPIACQPPRKRGLASQRLSAVGG